MKSASRQSWRLQIIPHTGLVINAGSLVGSTAITSGLGFIFWWLAARLFPADAVGLASAGISAMMLLSTLAVLGLGTLLVGELPRDPENALPLISTALFIAGLAGGGLGIAFALAAPLVTPSLAIGQGPEAVLLFGAGVGLTALTMVLDQALIGLLRGALQLWRNTLFATAKLLILAALGFWAASRDALLIYGIWAAGNIISLVYLAAVAARRGVLPQLCRLRLGPIRRLGQVALGHHALNLVLQAPSLLLPMLVTALLSASMNARFYIAWMIASFAFVGPASLGTVLFAIASAEPDALAQKVRMTLKLGLAFSLLAAGALWLGSGFVLGIFNHSYAEQATPCVRILGLGVFPWLIRSHYVTLRRLQNRTLEATLFVALGALLELLGAAMGARMGGLTGLSVGWLLAIAVESSLMLPAVRAAAILTR